MAIEGQTRMDRTHTTAAAEHPGPADPRPGAAIQPTMRRPARTAAGRTPEGHSSAQTRCPTAWDATLGCDPICPAKGELYAVVYRIPLLSDGVLQSVPQHRVQVLDHAW